MRVAGLHKAIRRAIRRAVAESAPENARDLADRAISTDEAVRNDAYEQISEPGMEPVELMGEAYRRALVGRRPDPSPGAAADFLDLAMPYQIDGLPADCSDEYHEDKITNSCAVDEE
jgi:hypothetical protein